MTIEITKIEEALASHGYVLKGSPTLPLLRLNQIGFATFATDVGFATVKCDERGKLTDLLLYTCFS